jgi:hypothetical protein
MFVLTPDITHDTDPLVEKGRARDRAQDKEHKYKMISRAQAVRSSHYSRTIHRFQAVSHGMVHQISEKQGKVSKEPE